MLAMIVSPAKRARRQLVTFSRTAIFGRSHCASTTIGAFRSKGCSSTSARATTINAEIIHKQDTLGTIEKGKFADIIAVAGDPLTDITEMQRVKFVMKGGAVVRNDLAAGTMTSSK